VIRKIVMAKERAIAAEGTVVESLPNATFRVVIEKDYI